MSPERRRVEWEAATTGDMIAAAVLVALLTPLVRTTAGAIVDGRDGRFLLAALGLGIVAADVTTGFLHWLCDTYFAEDTPIIGPAIIEPFFSGACVVGLAGALWLTNQFHKWAHVARGRRVVATRPARGLTRATRCRT